MRFRCPFRLLAAALLAALLSVVVSGEAVHAQTIDNIAHTKWVFGGDTYETTSNTVSVDVDRSKPVITVYRPTTGSGTGISYRAPRCDTASIASAKVSQQAGNTDAELISAIVETSDKVSPGGSILFDVLVPVANIDPRIVDSVDVQVISSAGDSERLTIFETGENTGHFIGRILTHHVPPAPSATDCRLGVKDGGTVEIEIHAPGSAVIVATATVDVLADPFGVVFDSETGEEISGARVTLIDAATGQPATVFAEDGITRWPSTVISGQAITDAAGNTYQIGPGEYWFPLTALGSYRVLVEPPDMYTAPSVATPAQLQQLVREDGSTFVIVDGSFGDRFVLVDQVPRRIDIPLDWSGGAVTVAKTASRDRAEPGDVIFYAITVQNPDASRVKRNVVLVDTPSRWLRFRRDSVRVDGERIEDAAQFSADGSELRIELGDIAGGATRRVTYAMTVRPDAPPGDAENRAVAIDSLGREIIAGTSVEIEREAIASRMTIIGRVTAGDCSLIDSRRGIPGVRVMLEDGSFAMTDSEGRYHFEGVVPGTHVVQASRMTLPEGGEFVNCHRDTRNAGSSTSRFAIGQGGSLVVADFHARLPEYALPSAVEKVVETGGDEAGAEREGDAVPEANGPATDWIALGDGPDGWLTPEIGHNPRAPAIRVAIRHRKGQKIALRVDGQPVSGLNFEGTREAEAGKYAVSQWRGIPLKHERTMLSADIINSFGEINETIEREVFFTTAPAKVELVPELSNLVADGRTRPVVAVRVLDRNNRPLREGVAGEFTLSAPYQSAEQIERQQLDQLTGLEASS
ncbi:MAG TPA: hypothetical protein DCF81_16235, partial [Erythrobacter sp.]|nr:hypothetical protein [Erythrobacter sp.]